MGNINYQIQGGLSLEQIQRIHTEALGLIERLGLRKIARKKIAEHEYQLEAEKRHDLEAIYQRAKKETE